MDIKPKPGESFEIALKAMERASKSGRCKAAKSARRRALSALSQVRQLDGAVAADESKAKLDAVKMGMCRVRRKGA